MCFEILVIIHIVKLVVKFNSGIYHFVSHSRQIVLTFSVFFNTSYCKDIKFNSFIHSFIHLCIYLSAF